MFLFCSRIFKRTLEHSKPIRLVAGCRALQAQGSLLAQTIPWFCDPFLCSQPKLPSPAGAATVQQNPPTALVWDSPSSVSPNPYLGPAARPGRLGACGIRAPGGDTGTGAAALALAAPGLLTGCCLLVVVPACAVCACVWRLSPT